MVRRLNNIDFTKVERLTCSGFARLVKCLYPLSDLHSPPFSPTIKQQPTHNLSSVCNTFSENLNAEANKTM